MTDQDPEHGAAFELPCIHCFVDDVLECLAELAGTAPSARAFSLLTGALLADVADHTARLLCELVAAPSARQAFVRRLEQALLEETEPESELVH